MAVNPYKDLPGLYDLRKVREYEGVPIGELPPHIFAIGNATYYSLRRTKKNQCVVIRFVELLPILFSFFLASSLFHDRYRAVGRVELVRPSPPS